MSDTHRTEVHPPSTHTFDTHRTDAHPPSTHITEARATGAHKSSAHAPDINSARVLATFLELVQIDSPSGEEAALAAYCRAQFEAAGCTVREDASVAITGSDTGNLFITLPAYQPAYASQARPLYFSAHLDCVNPCRGVSPRVQDGVVYSNGTTVLGGDDKAGIAALLEMVRCLREFEANGEPHPEVHVLLSVQEEQGLVGARAMNPADFGEVQGALCYVIDAAGKPGLVVNGAPYQHSYTATYTGKAAHAGIAPEAGISALRAAAKAVATLPQGRLDQQTTTNVGTISGGAANNIVAQSCRVTGELRSHSPERLAALEHEIDALLRAAAADDGTGAGAADVALDWVVNYQGFFVPEDSPAVALAFKAARSLGLKTGAEVSGGGADTNILAAWGFEAVSLGCGMNQIHSTAECLAVQDLEDITRLCLRIATLAAA